MYEIVTAPEAFEDVRSALEQKALTLDVAEVTMMPQNTVPWRASRPSRSCA